MELLLQRNMEFGATYIGLPKPQSLMFGFRINDLVSLLKSELCFCINTQDSDTNPGSGCSISTAMGA